MPGGFTLGFAMHLVIIIITVIIILKPTSTKPQAEILTLNKVNGCNDVSFGDHSFLEGDRILPLKSHGQALEELLLLLLLLFCHEVTRSKSKIW